MIEEMWTTGGHGIGFMKDVIRNLKLSPSWAYISPPIVGASTFVATAGSTSDAGAGKVRASTEGLSAR